MDASTVPLQLLVGRGFVPAPGPGSPVASGKPKGEGEDKGLLWREVTITDSCANNEKESTSMRVVVRGEEEEEEEGEC